MKHRIVTANRTNYGLKKQLSSRCFGRQPKCNLYKPRVGPTLTSGSESWPPKRKDKNMFRITESRALRRTYGPITENGTRRSSYSHELYELCNETDILKNLHSGGWSPNWVHLARRPLTGLSYLPRVIVRMENLVQ
jgi:hypothetical protein